MSKGEQTFSKKSLSRRDLLKLLGGTIGTALLAGCMPVQTEGGAAPAAPEKAEVEAPPAEPKTMVVAQRREYFKEMEDFFREGVQGWADENNVEIEFTTVAAEATEDYVAKLVAAVQAGNPPDLVYHVRQTQQLFFLDALEQVDDTVEQAVALYGEVPYLQVLAQKIEGHWYGIPYMLSGGGIFARGDVFEAGGFDPDSLETWDSRRDAALAVSDPESEMYGWGMTVNRSGDGAGLVTGVINDFGGSVTDKEMTKITFDSPETVAAVAWLTEIYTSDTYAKMLPPGIMSWTDSSNNEAYLAGNIAITSNAASVYAKAKADGSPYYESTVYLKNPIGPSGLQRKGFGGGQFMIPKGAKEMEAAKELALYMLEPEVFLPISVVSAGLFLPSYQKYFEMETVLKEFEADPNLARMGEEAFGDYPGFSYPADPSPFFDTLLAEGIPTDILAQTIVQGVSPEEAVKQAADRMAQIAEEMEALS
jgi:multiple sugar transport system substrate-binding protein